MFFFGYKRAFRSRLFFGNVLYAWLHKAQHKDYLNWPPRPYARPSFSQLMPAAAVLFLYLGPRWLRPEFQSERFDKNRSADRNRCLLVSGGRCVVLVAFYSSLHLASGAFPILGSVWTTS